MIVRRKNIENDFVTLYFILQRMKISLIIKKKKLKKEAKVYRILYKNKKIIFRLFLENEKNCVTDYFNLLDKYKSYKKKYQMQSKIRLFTSFCKKNNCNFIRNLVFNYIKITISYNMIVKYNFFNVNNIMKLDELMGYESETKSNLSIL